MFQSDFSTISWITYSFDSIFSLRNIKSIKQLLEGLVQHAESYV